MSVIAFVLAFAFALVGAPGYAQSVWTTEGNVFFRDHGGETRQLTHSKRDGGPVLAPNGTRVAFVRTLPGAKIWAARGDVDPQEIRIINVDGTSERRLVSSIRNPQHASNRAGLHDLSFSPDGEELFFLSDCAATGCCLHRVDVRTRRTRVLSGSDGYEVLRCGEHMGYLLVACGWHDEVWLMSADGKHVRAVGPGDGDAEFRKTVESFMAGDGCRTVSPPNPASQPTPREGAPER